MRRKMTNDSVDTTRHKKLFKPLSAQNCLYSSNEKDVSFDAFDLKNKKRTIDSSVFISLSFSGTWRRTKREESETNFLTNNMTDKGIQSAWGRRTGGSKQNTDKEYCWFWQNCPKVERRRDRPRLRVMNWRGPAKKERNLVHLWEVRPSERPILTLHPPENRNTILPLHLRSKGIQV